MALWGKTDAVGSIPKYINLSNYPAGTRIVFVDSTEASIADNKSRGLNSPGWWLFRTWTDANGRTRRKAEQLISFGGGLVADTGDNNADDDILKDLTMTFTTQPSDSSVAVGATATFTIVSNPSTGVTYQWQRSTDNGVTWANQANGSGFSNMTTASMSVVTTAPMTGNRFRCVVTKTAGDAATITSNAATLTVS